MSRRHPPQSEWPGQVWECRHPWTPPVWNQFAVSVRGCPDRLIAFVSPVPEDGPNARRNALAAATRIARDPGFARRSHLAAVMTEWDPGADLAGRRPLPCWMFGLQARPVGQPDADPIHLTPFCPYRLLWAIEQARSPQNAGWLVDAAANVAAGCTRPRVLQGDGLAAVQRGRMSGYDPAALPLRLMCESGYAIADKEGSYA